MPSFICSQNVLLNSLDISKMSVAYRADVASDAFSNRVLFLMRMHLVCH